MLPKWIKTSGEDSSPSSSLPSWINTEQPKETVRYGRGTSAKPFTPLPKRDKNYDYNVKENAINNNIANPILPLIKTKPKLDMMPRGSGKWGQSIAPKEGQGTVGVGKTGAVKITPRAYNGIDATVTGLLDGASIGTVNGLTNKLTGNTGNMDDGNHKLAYGAGKMAGYLVPGITGANALKPVLKGITKPLVNRLAEGAIVGGGMSTIEDLSNGKNLKETAKNAGLNMALGGGLDLGFYGLGKGISAIGKKLSTPKIELLQNKPLTPILNDFKSASNNIQPIDNNLIGGGIGIKNAPIYDNGSGMLKTSELKTNTLKNSEFLQQPETQKMIDDIQAQYEIKPNVQSVNRATQDLTKDFKGTMDRIVNSQALNSAEDTTSAGLITRQLRQEASSSGDYTQLKSWLETIQPKVTETAQSLQALNTWQKLSPESTLFKIQQVVGKVNREGEKTFGKNFKKVDFTPEEMKWVNDEMTTIEGMPTTTPKEIRAKDVAFAKVKQFAADKVPSTLADKVQSIQRISLLLNPKTMLRNIYGNVIMGGLENIKDIPASLIDIAVSKLKGTERTTLMPSVEGLKTQGKGLYNGLKNTLQDAKAGVDTNPSRGQYELPNKTIFKGGLGKLEKATSIGLTLGDRPFYQAAYDESLRQSMKIAKVTEPTKAMTEAAVKMAEDRTYQNTTSLVKGFRNIQKGLNKMTGNENMGLGTVAMPFVKTPANILDKAIDYSPIGTIKGITQLMSKKTFDQKLFVDRIGRSLTGSSMIALGYELANKGLVTGQSNKDKDMAALDKQAGKQAYAIKSGNTYHTIDWMQPAAIPLMIGADMFYGGKTKKDTVNVISDAIKSGGTTLFQQSLLQGVQKLFGGYDPISGVSNVVTGIPTQFIPGSLSKQLAQLSDSTVRDTYSPNKLKTMTNQVQSKIPGLSKLLPAKIDTMGRDVKQFNGKDNLYNTFLNPGFTSKYNPSKAETIATDVYNATGNKGVFPRVAKNTITYKDNEENKIIQLTPTEKQQLQRYIGQETEKQFNNIDSETDMEKQAKALQKILSKVYTEGENIILKGRGINGKK